MLVQFDHVEEFIIQQANECAMPTSRFSGLEALAADFRETLEQARIWNTADPTRSTIHLGAWCDRSSRQWRVWADVSLPKDGGTMTYSLWYSGGELRLHLWAMGVMQGAAIRLRSGRYVCHSEAIEAFDCSRDEARSWLLGTISLHLSPDFSDIYEP